MGPNINIKLKFTIKYQDSKSSARMESQNHINLKKKKWNHIIDVHTAYHITKQWTRRIRLRESCRETQVYLQNE
jgi:hypothetical protein